MHFFIFLSYKYETKCRLFGSINKIKGKLVFVVLVVHNGIFIIILRIAFCHKLPRSSCDEKKSIPLAEIKVCSIKGDFAESSGFSNELTSSKVNSLFCCSVSQVDLNLTSQIEQLKIQHRSTGCFTCKFLGNTFVFGFRYCYFISHYH